jgi:translation initiation factor RLI1
MTFIWQSLFVFVLLRNFLNMKVYILRHGGELIGVFSSKEKVESAEAFYYELPYFDNQNIDFRQEEVELDKFSDEEYRIEDKVKDESIKGKVKDFALKILGYFIGFILLMILGLGISSFFEMVFNLFKH